MFLFESEEADMVTEIVLRGFYDGRRLYRSGRVHRSTNTVARGSIYESIWHETTVSRPRFTHIDEDQTTRRRHLLVYGTQRPTPHNAHYCATNESWRSRIHAGCIDPTWSSVPR